MRFRTLLATCLLGAVLPLTSYAQTAPDAPRFYVGVGANMLSNIPFKDQGLVSRLFGPSLTAGMQFTPRLAGQIGLSYQWKKDSYAYQYVGQTGYTVVNVANRANYFYVPVLLRYTVTKPAERFHFDIAGGATVLFANGSTSYQSSGVIDPALRDNSSTDVRFNLTLGPAVRATLSPHLELTATSFVSAVVGDSYYRFSDRLFLNTSLGINYTFGQR